MLQSKGWLGLDISGSSWMPYVQIPSWIPRAIMLQCANEGPPSPLKEVADKGDVMVTSGCQLSSVQNKQKYVNRASMTVVRIEATNFLYSRHHPYLHAEGH